MTRGGRTSRQIQRQRSPKNATGIASLIAARSWPRAEKQIRLELKTQPESHWLWERLSAIRYQRRKYADALEFANKALEIMPQCSLALWDKAEALAILGQTSAAMAIYDKLCRGSIAAIMKEPCSEGVTWARGIVADSCYRLGRLYAKGGKKTKALKCLRRSLSLRASGAKSVYPVQQIREELKLIED